MYGSASWRVAAFWMSSRSIGVLEDVLRQVLGGKNRLERLLHVLGVDVQLALGALGGAVAQLLEQGLEDRVQAPGSDVLGPLVRLGRVLGDRVDGVLGEAELDALGGEERHVLAGERVLGLGEDPDEVLLLEGLELDADREAALELGDQVRDLGDVERAG